MRARPRSSSARRQRLGIALLVPVVLLVPYLLLTGTVRAPFVVWPTVAVALAVSAWQLRSTWHGPVPRPVRNVNRVWMLGGTVLGVAGLVALLTVGLQVEDVAVYAVVVAVLLVVEVQAFAGGQRSILVVATLVLWSLLLLSHGVTAPATLLLHAAGALVLVVGTARIADELAAATAAAAGERRRAERRATVLAEVLRSRSVDPAEVRRAVLRGLDAVGFEVMAIRHVDAFAGRAVLVDHRTHLPREVEVDASTDLGLLGVAIRERREVVVDDVTADPRAIDRGEGFRGGIVLPLLDRGEVFATIEAVVRSGPLDDFQVAAVRQLGSAAERALVRARALAEDRRLVRELERLQSRTEAFVTASADGVAAPMRALRADVRRLQLPAVGTDEAQRAAAVRRIDEHARRLASLVRAMVDGAAMADSHLELDLQPVALRTLVSAVVGDASVDAPDHVVVDVAPDLVVHVDRALVERLLQEILTAVAAHGPTGTVQVSARRVGDRVRLAINSSSVWAVDDPVGVAVARQVVPDRSVVTLTTAAAIGGAGWHPPVGPVLGDEGQPEALGLAIAQQIARAHGSDLSVQGPPGRPATVACTLPPG